MSTLRANLQSTVSMPRRLARDERGNVVWIMAFALIPLIGLVGAGIDMTRAYMANTRLQAACDSGVLAGRKDMAGVEYTAANQQTALDHFTVNYGPNEFRSSNVSFESERLPSGEVTGKATASMPTAIMHIMGRDTIDLSATCGARMDLTNADIVFVLDTTGSMNQMAGKMTRIEGLRAAVTNFTDVLNKSNNSNRRIRYGFVPYSSSVNVGGLLKPAWLANKWTYQSRRVGETLIQEGYNSATANFKYVSGTIEWIRTPMLPETCIPPANKMNWNEELVSEVKSELPDGRKVITQYRKTTSNGSVFTIEREKDNNGKVTQCYVVEQKRTDYVET